MFKDHQEILVTGIVGVLLVVFLVIVFILSIVRYKKRVQKDLKEKETLKELYEQELLQSKLETQEQTFQQIGKELHDNVGQLLSTSRMLLGLTERSMAQPPDTLLTANATLGQAIMELRSLSKSLDKEWLEQFSFTHNLETEIARINAGNKIKADYFIGSSIPLRSDEQIILFRIVQEAIQNAIKHASPDTIHIHLTPQNGNFIILIEDNGEGFVQPETAKGMGLTNMKHRTGLLGGTISWGTNKGKGTVVKIVLPINHESI
jgi:signal transduction histidine kinase